MNSNVASDAEEYIKSHGKNVESIKELSPCYRFIYKLINQKRFEILNGIMEPNNAYDYSLLLCLSILRTTQAHRDNIRNWNRFKLVTQYIACNSKDVSKKDLETMFMGLWNE